MSASSGYAARPPSSRNEWQGHWLIQQGWVSQGEIAQVFESVRGRPDGALAQALAEQGRLSPAQLQQLFAAEQQALGQTSSGRFPGAGESASGRFVQPVAGVESGAMRPGSSAAGVTPGGGRAAALPGPGDRFGGYRIKEEISRGGMGVVYRVEDEEGAEFALKLLMNADADTSLAERFRREATVLARLSHPGVVRIVNCGELGGLLFLVMPIIAGQTLRERVQQSIKERGEAPSVSELADLFGELAGALAYCHELGVIHRDLKPDNIIIQRSTGRPVLIDFGLVKAGALDGRSLSQTGELIGTPAFMSPEQLESAKEVGPAADVWSLGATLFFALTGQEPFQAGSRVELMAAVLNAAIPAPRTLRKIPRELDSLVTELMSREPDARPGLREVQLRLRGDFARKPRRPLSRALLVGLGVVVPAAAIAAVLLWPKPRLLFDKPPSAPVATRTLTLTGRLEGTSGGLVRSGKVSTLVAGDGGFRLEVPIQEGPQTVPVEFARSTEGPAEARVELPVTGDFTPPQVELEELPERTAETRLAVTGRVSEPCRVSLGGGFVETDAEGRFALTWELVRGMNRGRLVAEDAAGLRRELPLAVSSIEVLTLAPGDPWPKLEGPPRQLRLTAGEHEVSAEVRAKVWIEPAPGAKPNEVVLKGRDRDVLQVVGGELHLARITLKAAPGRPGTLAGRPDDQVFPAAVRVREGTATLTDCVLGSQDGVGLSVGGDAARAVARDCRFEGCRVNGVRSVSGARVELASCRFGVSSTAIIAKRGSAITLQDCEVSGPLIGLYADEDSELSGKRVAINGTRTAACAVHSKATMRFEELTVDAQKGYGVRCFDGGSIELIRSRITAGSGGVFVRDGTLLLRELTVRSSGGSGISVRRGRVEGRQLVARACARHGLEARLAIVVLHGVDIRDCKLSGVLGDRKSYVFLANGTISGCGGDGVTGSGLTRLDLDHLELIGNGGYGFRQGPGAMCWTCDLTARDNKAGDWEVKGARANMSGGKLTPKPPKTLPK